MPWPWRGGRGDSLLAEGVTETEALVVPKDTPASHNGPDGSVGVPPPAHLAGFGPRRRWATAAAGLAALVVAACGVAASVRSPAPFLSRTTQVSAVNGTLGAALLPTPRSARGTWCADVGEDCRGMLCCRDAGQRCFQKDKYWAGCRSECVPGAPDEGAPGGWECNVASRSCACDARCHAQNDCPAFPEVDFIYIPKVAEDVDRLARFLAEYDQYVPCGRDIVRKVAGVSPGDWPQGQGRYEDVQRFGMQLPTLAPGTSIWVGLRRGMMAVSPSSPWWFQKHLSYAEKNDQGQSTWFLEGPPLAHHAGCTLSHFVTWMDARERGVPNMIISESDATLSQWWTPYAQGAPEDYAGAVRAFLEEAPTAWDVLFFDKGRQGVAGSAAPVLSLVRECWATSYDVYQWTGGGVAGAALYMVSRGFLEKVPGIIQNFGLDMVDAWLGDRCKQGGPLKCFSILAPKPAAPCDRMCSAKGQPISCRKRVQLALQLARPGQDNCDVAHTSVHGECRMCTGCTLNADECLAATPKAALQPVVVPPPVVLPRPDAFAPRPERGEGYGDSGMGGMEGAFPPADAADFTPRADAGTPRPDRSSGYGRGGGGGGMGYMEGVLPPASASGFAPRPDAFAPQPDKIMGFSDGGVGNMEGGLPPASAAGVAPRLDAVVARPDKSMGYGGSGAGNTEGALPPAAAAGFAPRSDAAGPRPGKSAGYGDSWSGSTEAGEAAEAEAQPFGAPALGEEASAEAEMESDAIVSRLADAIAHEAGPGAAAGVNEDDDYGAPTRTAGANRVGGLGAQGVWAADDRSQSFGSFSAQ